MVGSIDLNAVPEEITRRITAINIDESLKTSVKRSITLLVVQVAITVKIPVLCIGLFAILIFIV